MEYLHLTVPPYPHFIVAGTALYRPGDTHNRRANIGIYDLLFIEYGELFITDGDQQYHLQQNDVLIIRPDSIHFGHKNNSQKTRFYWLHFDAPGKSNYSSDSTVFQKTSPVRDYYQTREDTLILPIYKQLTPSSAAEFSSILSRLATATIDKYLQTETQEPSIPTPLECQMLFLRLLTYLQLELPRKNDSNLLAEHILEYILLNYHNRITLEGIADYFHFHPVHIIRSIKKRYGITPNKLITQIRMEQAHHLLHTTDCSVEKIAEMTGFSSVSYFDKVFKKYWGMAPGEMRGCV